MKLLFIQKGNCRTAIVCCVTPASHFMAETTSTLKFASSAKKIRTQVVVNQIADVTRNIRSYQDQVEHLQRTLQDERDLFTRLQQELETLKQNGTSSEKLVQALEAKTLVERQCSLLTGDLASLERDLVHSRERVTQLEQNLAQERNDQAVKTSQLQNTLEQVQSGCQAQQVRLSSAESALAQLTFESNESVADLKMQLALAQQAKDLAVQELNARHQRLVGELRLEMDSMERKNDDLAKACSDKVENAQREVRLFCE